MPALAKAKRFEDGVVSAPCRRCEDCDSVLEDRPCIKYCDPCRSARRRKKTKYFFTPRMDEAIAAAYSERADARGSHKIPNLTELAENWRMPKFAVVKRAGNLGLARIKESAWSEQELQIMRLYSWMTVASIAKKLRARGFKRSATAVKLKLRRTNTRREENTDYYTARGLAECFGVDSHAITKWINRGLLTAGRQNSEGSRFIYLIHEKDVYKFVLQNPMEYDLRKVDQLWFLDMITNGKIGNGTGL